MKKMFWLDSKPSIWARAFARAVDYCIFYLLVTLASMIFPFYIEDLYYVSFAALIPVFWAPLEAFLVFLCKTTPGKALFGMRIETHLGGRLPFWISLKRAFFFGIRPGILRQKQIKAPRMAIGVLVLAALLGSSYYEKEIAVATTGFEQYRKIDGWKDYKSADGKFKVNFPEDPSHESKILPVPSQNKNLNYEELTSYQTKKVYYSVTYIEIPSKWKLAGSHKLLNGALDILVDYQEGATLLGKSMMKHQQYRALDFHMKQGEEEVQGRLVLVGTTLFRLAAVYPPGSEHQLQHEAFVNSFEVRG